MTFLKGNMQPVIIELLTYSSLIHGSIKLSRLEGF